MIGVNGMLEPPSKGFAHRAITIDSRGKAQDAIKRVFGNRVTVPEFEIYSNPTIKISDIASRRFNIIDRK